jgi:hypothetical protein
MFDGSAGLVDMSMIRADGGSRMSPPPDLNPRRHARPAHCSPLSVQSPDNGLRGRA